MARADAVNRLIARQRSISSFNYELLSAPPLLSLLTPYDIKQLEDISKDPRLNAKLLQKREYINQILVPKGFRRFASGTNRIVYKFLEDQSILLKVAISDAGINDSPKENYNQHLLKPYCAKCFEVSPTGAVGLFERVDNITSIQQYLSIADDIYNLLDRVIGKYIMADIGSKFFMNIGVRKGFGPVFLDYPLVFELDGRKLFCNEKDPFTMIPCGGEIDYDDGYNFLFCRKCGKQYFANQLAKENFDGIIMEDRKETSSMVIEVTCNGKTKTGVSVNSANNYLEYKRRGKKKPQQKSSGMTVEVINPRKKKKEQKRDEKGRFVKEALETTEEIKEEPVEEKVESASFTIEGTDKYKEPADAVEETSEPEEEEVETIDEEEIEEVVEEKKKDLTPFKPKQHAPFPREMKSDAQHSETNTEPEKVQYKVNRRNKPSMDNY